MLVAFIDLFLAAALAVATPTASAAPTGDDAVIARAEVVLAGLQAGTVDRSQLTPELDALLTPSVLAIDRHELPTGTPAAFGIRGRTHVDGETTFDFRVRWPAGAVDYIFGTNDATGKIDKLFTRPGPP